MRQIRWILLLVFTAVFFAACEPSNDGANTNGAAEPAKDLKTVLVERNRAAQQAWMKKDGKFFETFLADDHLGQSATGTRSKAGVIAFVTGSECDVKSTDIVDAQVMELGGGAVLLTRKSTAEGTCGGNELGTYYGGGVYVKDGDNWVSKYYQSVAAAKKEGDDKAATDEDAGKADADKKEASAEKADADKEEAKPEPPAAGDAELTKALTEIDNALWLAFEKKDSDAFDKVLAANFSELTPNGFVDRAAALKGIAESKCEIKNNTLAEFNSRKINDTVALLTYTATVNGTCDGKPMPKTAYISTVFVKDGDTWKPVFHMETPGAE